MFVIAIAAAELGVGLAIVLLIFRNSFTVSLDEVNLLEMVTTLAALQITPPAAASTGAPLEMAWLIPVIPMVSAAVIWAVGKRFPSRGAEIGILAMLAVLAGP